MQNRAFQISVHERALAAATDYRRSEKKLLEAIDEAEAHGVFEMLGHSSMFNYCINELNLTESTTYYFIAVARKAREIPELALAIEEGELTVSKAARVVSVITPENQEELIDKAKKLTKADIEKEVAKLQPEKKKKPTIKPVGDDRNKLTAEINHAYAEKLKRVQDLESQRTNQAASIEHALEKALDAYLEKFDPVKKAERSKMKPSKAKPGRKIDATTKNKVMKRDQHKCQEKLPNGEICGSARWVDVHHVVHWSEGGTHDPENLITLCRPHHRQKHDSAWAESRPQS